MEIQGHITVLEELTGGGLGKLLKCQDEAGQWFVAKFPKDTSPENQELIDDEARRFRRHQGHHVVRYLGPVTLQDGRRGFAMELMDGDLTPLVRQRLSVERVLGYLLTVVQGLEEVHASARGAFHGDLKTGNILHKDGVAKLADFGLARGGLGQTVMLGNHNGGTPGYMPPEGLASPSGDIYSLGAVAFALLVGREPQAYEVLRIQIPGAPGLEQLINQMLAAQPGMRPSISQIRARLGVLRAQALAQAQVQHFPPKRNVLRSPAAPTPPPVPALSSSAYGMGVAAALVAFVGFGLLLAANKD
ncbi:protein kinase domain-containing protein [Stigmatella erecta]|uniref:non-specific serine/threonine protein kinase n=1 Tax=Stigmatella erecta TaxID=83460 RepID=A0A1I0H3C6_9BACT|nr:protein kinase [Stigmatella erecta]SET78211.1 Serine/threonine protein kinase [Stigmatella erecta]